MQTKSDIHAVPAQPPLSGLALVNRLEQLSALIDDQASPDEVKDVTAAFHHSPQVRESWAVFQHVGECLREGDHALPPPSQAFAAGVMARLAADRNDSLTQPQVKPKVRQEAANDPVFRWKLVAGVATLAAVAAVVWQVALPSAGSAGGQWAQAPQNVPVQLASQMSTAPQAVLTQQGVLLRDPQLEALLAAHRQQGGQSALQMPAGFLRNATYEVPQR